MGLLEILIGSFAVIIVLVIFMQPVSILNDIARDSLTDAGSTIKYGTDTDGNVIAIGTSSALPDVTTIFLYMIGIAIVGGFFVWIIRFGRGGVYDQGAEY